MASCISFDGCLLIIIRNIPYIVDKCQQIIANRMVDEIRDVADKVYTLDLFGKD